MLEGSILFFIRLDENDNPKRSGEPYCTICSKSALDVGISKFAYGINLDGLHMKPNIIINYPLNYECG